MPRRALPTGRFPDPRRIGYVLGAMIGFQAVGALAGLAIGYHHDWFMNAWIGGALATLPGFVVGTVYHFRRERDPREAVKDVCFVGALAVALTGFAIWPTLPGMTAEMGNLEAMRGLQFQTVDRIDVFDSDWQNRIATITSPEALAGFAKACADVEGDSPNHPTYTDTWYLAIEGSTRHEVEVHYQAGVPDAAVGDFVVSGSTIHYFGSFKSRALRPWVDQYLVPLTAE